MDSINESKRKRKRKEMGYVEIQNMLKRYFIECSDVKIIHKEDLSLGEQKKYFGEKK